MEKVINGGQTRNVVKRYIGLETGVLNWICHVRPTHSPCEGPEDTHFTITVRSKVWRGAARTLEALFDHFSI